MPMVVLLEWKTMELPYLSDIMKVINVNDSWAAT